MTWTWELGYVCTVTLTLEIRPWFKIMIHPLVTDKNCMKYCPDSSRRVKNLWLGQKCGQTDSWWITRIIQKVLLCTKYYVISNASPYLVYSNLFRKVSWTKAHFNQSRDLLSTQQSCLPWYMLKTLTSLTSAAIFVLLNWLDNVFFGKGNSHKSL